MPIRQLTNYPDTEGLVQYTADAVITGAVKAKFMADSHVPFSAISVETSDGIAGPLNFDYERYSTEALLPKVSRGIGTLSLLIFQLFCSTVKLTGYVDQQQQITQAEKIALSVKGVKAVKNQLHIKS